jgi:hypothetical protein
MEGDAAMNEQRLGDVLVIDPGHGSYWLTRARYVDRFGSPNPRGRYVEGLVWYYDGGWNMPDDYRGEWLPVIVPRRYVLKIEAEPARP